MDWAAYRASDDANDGLVLNRSVSFSLVFDQRTVGPCISVGKIVRCSIELPGYSHRAQMRIRAVMVGMMVVVSRMAWPP